MSYTEYLSRKKAAAAVILDTRPKMDASTYTRHQRVVAAGNRYAPTKSVVGNIHDMRTSAGRDNNGVKAGVQVTLETGQGGRVPDGSTFSDYAAGRAAEMDYKTGPPLGKVLMNSTASGSLSGCSIIPGPVASKNASSNTTDIMACRERQGEPHIGAISPPLFVDNTISVNGVFGSGMGDKGVPKKSDGNPVPDFQCPRVVHDHPATIPRAGWSARPSKGSGGLFNPVVPSQDHPYKAGALVPSDHLKYVEKHHGNDFNVNPRRYPKTPYQIPAGTVAHLRINDEHRGI
jgi:hypothetical protein